MVAVSDHDDAIHVAFFLRNDGDEAWRSSVVEHIKEFSGWLDRERPIGISLDIVVRHVEYAALLACHSLAAMVGSAEALQQVFELCTAGKWQQ